MNEKNIKVFIDFGSSKIRLGVFSIEISKNILRQQEFYSNPNLDNAIIVNCTNLLS